jgi:transcriptional regulator with XRE-family HTH domain
MTKRSRSTAQPIVTHSTSTGHLIAQRRAELRLTQQELYETSGLRGGSNVISQYEGNRRTPSIYALHKLARALDTTMENLIGEV